MRFTDISLRHLPTPKTGQQEYYDDSLTGFGYRIGRRTRRFFVLLREHGRQRRITLAHLGLAEARAEARKILAANTLYEKSPVALTGATFGEAVETFLLTHVKVHNRPTTAYENERLLRKHFLPPLRLKKMAQVTTYDLLHIFDALTVGTRSRAFPVVRKLFAWAKGRRYLVTSPCDGLTGLHFQKARERTLTKDELRAVYTSVLDGLNTHRIVLLLALTGQRKRQFTHLRWNYLDMNARNINWPAEAMKGNKAHFIPMTDTMHAMFQRYQQELRIGDVLPDYVFPIAHKDSPTTGWSKALPRFHTLSKTSGWSLHDLRRTFSTVLGEAGTAPHIIDALTAHTGTIGRVAKVYNRYQYRAEMLEALQLFERLTRSDDTPTAENA